MCITMEKQNQMKNKPINKSPLDIQLVRESYQKVMKDRVVTPDEMDYLRRLYKYIFKKEEKSEQVILDDLKELGQWTVTKK